MKPGVLAAGLAAFFGVGTFLWLPLGAPAVQTLLDQSQAVGIAGDLNSRAQSNGQGSLLRVKRALEGLQQFVDEAEAIQKEQVARRPIHAAAPSGGQQAAQAEPDVLAPRALSEAKTPSEAKGRIFLMEGKITAVERVGGKAYYRISPDSSMGMKEDDSFLVEVPRGEASEGKAGQLVRAFGAFSRVDSARSGLRLFTFVEGQMVSSIAPGSPAPVPTAAPAPAPAAGGFSGPLKGWSLEGAVVGEGSATAVVVSPSGRPSFLQAGDSFGDGCRVVSVGNDQTVFLVDGRRIAVSP